MRKEKYTIRGVFHINEGEVYQVINSQFEEFSRHDKKEKAELVCRLLNKDSEGLKINKEVKKWLLMHHEYEAKQLFIWATEKFDAKIIGEETFNNAMEEVDRIKDAINFIKQLEVKK